MAGPASDDADIIASPPPRRPTPWPAGLAGLAVAAVLVLLGYLLLGRGDEAPQAQPGPTSAASPTTTPATRGPPQTSTPVEPADLTDGVLPDGLGLPSGITASRAAETVAGGYCARIRTWEIRLEPIEDYHRVVALLRPSGAAYPEVSLQIELTWDTDHYSWRSSRSALEACP